MTEASSPTHPQPAPGAEPFADRPEGISDDRMLDAPSKAAFDRILSLTARLFRVPIVFVALTKNSRVWVQSSNASEFQNARLETGLSNFALVHPDVLVIPDARQDDRLIQHPAVQGEPGIRFYASAPLLTQTGVNLGSLCLVDTKPGVDLTDEQRATLIDLAALILHKLERGSAALQIERERQQAEKIRQDTAQRLQIYADVFANTQMGIVVWQLEDLNDPGSFRLLIANAAASESVGLDFAPMIGKTMAEGFPKLLETSLPQQYLEVVRTGRSLDLGEVSYGEDGISTGVYSLKAFPLPHRCLGLSFENITVRKQIETQLKETQRFNQQIAETVPGILFVHDLIQQRNVYTNRQVTDLLGYTREQIQRMGTRLVETLIHPDDLPRVLAHFDSYQTAADNTVFALEYRMQHANGEWRWLNTQSVVFQRNPDGTPCQILGVSIDITDRKRSEQALQESEAWTRLATQVAQLGGWRLHLDTRLVEFDARMRQIWGEPDDVMMIPLSAVLAKIHPDDRDRVADAVNAAIDPASSGAYESEYRIVWNDGTEHWVLAKGQAQFEGEGATRRTADFFGTILDITAAKQREAERRQAEQALAEQEQRYRYIFESVGVAIWEEDFSEVKAAIDQLKASGLKDFRQYFAEHPEFVRQMARLVRVRDVNRAALTLFGAQEKAELLASLDRVFVPETQASFAEELLTIANEETFYASEIGLQTLQGERRHALLTITFPPASEQYNHVLASLLDITQRKQAETELQISEERLSLALRSAQAVMWQWYTLDDRSIWSDENFRMMGYEPGEVPACYESWRRALHPDDRDRADQEVQQALKEEAAFYSEYRVCLPDGSVRWLADLGQVIYDAQGNKEGMIGLQIDISKRKQSELERDRIEAELRQSEERLSLALRAANQGLYDLNLQTGAAIVSPEYARMLGYEPGEFQETNAKWRDRMHPDDIPTVYRTYEEYVAGRVSEYRVEFRQRTKTGGWVWILSLGKIVSWDENGNPLRMLGTHTDISDRKQAEQALKQQAEDLAQANRIKDEFLAVLSHELRSPLNPILGWTKLLQTGKFDAQKTQQALTIIERNAKQQTQLIDDLLDISKILRGKLVLNQAPVDLTLTIEAASETVRLAAEAKNIHITTDLDPSLPPVLGDSGRLQQIVSNLLSNAVKFTPNGGRIEVRLEQVEGEVGEWVGRWVGGWGDGEYGGKGAREPGSSENQETISNSSSLHPLNAKHSEGTPSSPHLPNPQSTHPPTHPSTPYAQITITDTGKGIAPDFLPHVFESFRQEDGTTTRNFGGLGLGLAIVRQLTELHGGTVQAESEGEGRGATFTVRLPLMKRWGAGEMGGWGDNQTPTAPASQPLKGLRVLVVDDEVDMRDLAIAILEQAGAIVQIAASATEALSVLQQFQPALLISDIGMPDTDGYRLMQQIRALPPDRGGQIPAIALTAYAAQGDQQQALESGFQKHLAKPVEPAVLIREIATLLGDCERA